VAFVVAPLLGGGVWLVVFHDATRVGAAGARAADSSYALVLQDDEGVRSVRR
jgi:hypothetical protein